MQPDTKRHLPALQDEDPRRKARYLYWQGFRIARIAELLGEKVATLHSWKRRDGWDKTAPLDRVTAVTEARLIQLTVKDNKEGKDFKEIDLLWRQMERGARIERYQQGENEVDLNPNLAKRNVSPRSSRKLTASVKSRRNSSSRFISMDCFRTRNTGIAPDWNTEFAISIKPARLARRCFLVVKVYGRSGNRA